ncbi:MAG: hypothetical protein LUQ59_12265, partial [Methanothrix sp.]|nr:hypothetical protein [Methanothrix sp.]
ASVDSVTTPAQPTLVTLNTAAAVGGDTVFVTAPGRYRFVGGSTVTVGTAAAAVASISTDSTQLRFAIGPNANDTVRVAGLQISGAPTLGPFGFKTDVRLVTPAAPPVTLNKTSAVAGDTIVVTAPARYRFVPGPAGSKVTVGTAGLALVGVSTDSTQLRFLIGPSANAAVTVTNVVIRGAPAALGSFTLNSGASVLTTPAIPNFPGTFVSATPAINDTVTLTAGAGFKILPTAAVTIGGQVALRVSISADSSSIKFVPSPGGAAGPATVAGVALSVLTSVSLTLPTSTNITPPALGAGLAGTGDFATAPTITLPASGKSLTFFDFGAFTGNTACTDDPGLGGDCRIYKLVLAAPTTFTFNTSWQGTTDLGMYFFNAALARQSGPCDSKGNGASGQPETCTGKTLAAGTWYIVVDDFGPFYTPPEAAPTWIRFSFNVN